MKLQMVLVVEGMCALAFGSSLGGCPPPLTRVRSVRKVAAVRCAPDTSNFNSGSGALAR